MRILLLFSPNEKNGLSKNPFRTGVEFPLQPRSNDAVKNCFRNVRPTACKLSFDDKAGAVTPWMCGVQAMLWS